MSDLAGLLKEWHATEHGKRAKLYHQITAMVLSPEFFSTLAQEPAGQSEALDEKKLLARVAAIICEETCGLTSECKSREAAKALLDKGYLSAGSASPGATAEPVAWRIRNDFGHWYITPRKALADTWRNIEKLDVEPLYAHPTVKVSGDAAEMRERAAKVASGHNGRSPKDARDIAAAIRALPLTPEGRS